MHDVRLEVQGVGFGGFRSGSFKLALEEMCNSFNLKYTDEWVERGEDPLIDEGERCCLVVDGNVMIDGWVDEANVSYDPMHYELTSTGRSTACDLVDCSALNSPGEWNNRSLGQIAAELVYPFSAVQLAILGDQGRRIPKFTLEDNETVGAALCRLARLRQMLVYTAGEQLVMAKVASTRTSTVLERGVNVLTGKRRASLADRYSDYVFKGQTRAIDERNGVAASQMHGAAEDHGVPRYRPFLVKAGGTDGPDDLGARAIMERNQRAGRAERFEVRVLGWMTDEGYLWEPNLLVRLKDDWMRVEQDLLVVAATFEFNGDTGAGGYQTTLELCDPRAFELGDVPLIRRPRARPVVLPLSVPMVYQWNAGATQSFFGQEAPRYLPARPQPSSRGRRHHRRRHR